MIVVTDTSVVLNLCLLGRAGLLHSLFGVVLAPPSVRAEFERLATWDPRFLRLVFPSFIRLVDAPSVPSPLTANRRLHRGETDALALAVAEKADAVLMDERAGRTAAAALGLRTVGIVGILFQAKEAGLIPAVRPLLDQLQSEAGFWIAARLREDVLARAGE